MSGASIFSVSLVLVSASGTSGTQAPVVAVRSWKSLDRDLAPDKVLMTASEMSKAPSYRKILETNNRRLFLEMAYQGEYTSITRAGFLAIKDKFPEDALAVGFQIYLNAHGRLLDLDDLIGAELKRKWPQQEFDAAFSDVMRSATADFAGVSAIVLSTNHENMFAWFHSQSRGWARPANESQVLERLFTEYRRRGKQPSAIMRKTLRSYADIPGQPRLDFLDFAEARDELFKSCLRALLEDESLGEFGEITIVHFVRKHKDFIKAELSIEKIQVSAKRRKLIERELAK